MTAENKAAQEIEAARLADQKFIQENAEPQEVEEIVGLREAFKRIDDKIAWHKLQIESAKLEIEKNNEQITALQNMVKTKFGNLIGQLGNPKKAAKPGPKPRKRKTGSTKELIMECLKRAGKAVNTSYVREFLESVGNDANPSVELNRLKQKELVTQPERGMYEWAGE